MSRGPMTATELDLWRWWATIDANCREARMKRTWDASLEPYIDRLLSICRRRGMLDPNDARLLAREDMRAFGTGAWWTSPSGEERHIPFNELTLVIAKP